VASLTAIGTPHLVTRLKTASATAAGAGMAGRRLERRQDRFERIEARRIGRSYSRETKTNPAMPGTYTASPQAPREGAVSDPAKAGAAVASARARMHEHFTRHRGCGRVADRTTRLQVMKRLPTP